MSTRAIVGIKRPDGTVLGAWNWNDGYAIKNNLERDFKTLADVGFLLGLGMFGSIYSQSEYEDYIEWAGAERVDISDKIFIRYGDSVIFQGKHHVGARSEVYKNTDDMLGQDISIAYLFEDGKWVSYR